MMALPPLRPRDCSVMLCRAALPATCAGRAGQVCPESLLTPLTKLSRLAWANASS